MKLVKDIGMINKGSYSVSMGIYECPKCKENFTTRHTTVRTGRTKSCRKCGSTRHGRSREKIYRCYIAIKSRCYNEKDKFYKDYGGRGILLCSEWLLDFNSFYEWSINNGYSKSLTIDRIDNDKGYEPDNCRWTNKTIQSRNTRKLRANNKSGYRGVGLSKKGKPFIAKIVVNKKAIHLGMFETAIEGARAYDKYVVDNNLEHTINGVDCE